MTKTKPPTSTPVVILFGLDDTNRPHAASFFAAHAALAEKAAQSLKLKVLKIETAEQAALAAQLPAGKVLATGQGSVPLVRKDLYNKLLALLPAAMKNQLGESRRSPSTWAEIDVGDMVLAEDPVPNDGWFEAIVLERTGDDGFKLRFRDYPEEGIVVRQRHQLALLSPS